MNIKKAMKTACVTLLGAILVSFAFMWGTKVEAASSTSSTFDFYNPNGDSDIAVFNGKFVSIKDLKDKYLNVSQSSGIYESSLCPEVTWKQQDEINGYKRYVVSFSSDSVLTAFIPKELFYTVTDQINDSYEPYGEFVFVGREYGYYIRTTLHSHENVYEDCTNWWYINDILIFDVDSSFEPSTGRFTNSLEVVLQTQTITYEYNHKRVRGSAQTAGTPSLTFNLFVESEKDSRTRKSGYSRFVYTGDKKYNNFITAPLIANDGQIVYPDTLILSNITYSLELYEENKLDDSGAFNIVKYPYGNLDENYIIIDDAHLLTYNQEIPFSEAYLNTLPARLGRYAVGVVNTVKNMCKKKWPDAVKSFLGLLINAEGHLADAANLKTPTVQSSNKISPETQNQKRFHSQAYRHREPSDFSQNAKKIELQAEDYDCAPNGGSKSRLRSLIVLCEKGNKITFETYTNAKTNSSRPNGFEVGSNRPIFNYSISVTPGHVTHKDTRKPQTFDDAVDKVYLHPAFMSYVKCAFNDKYYNKYKNYSVKNDYIVSKGTFMPKITDFYQVENQSDSSCPYYKFKRASLDDSNVYIAQGKSYLAFTSGYTYEIEDKKRMNAKSIFLYKINNTTSPSRPSCP